MYNDWLTIGPVTIHGYGAMIGIGIITAYFLACHLAEKRGLDKEKIFDLVIVSVLCGFLGAKILYLITVFPELLRNPAEVLKAFRDGWVVFGGLIGGIIGVCIFMRRKKLDMLAYLDVLISAVPLGQAFGRIGCFFAGCCYGRETTSAFSICFHHSYFAPNNVQLIPTQLISSGLDFLMVVVLLMYHKKLQKKNGEVLALFLILYSIGRFLVEFLRGDVQRGSVGVLSTSQFVSIFTLLIGLTVFALVKKMPEKAHETVSESAEAVTGEEEKVPIEQ